MPTERWRTKDKERTLDDPFFGYLFGGNAQIPGIGGLRTNELYPAPEQNPEIFDIFVASWDDALDFADVVHRCQNHAGDWEHAIEIHVPTSGSLKNVTRIVNSVVYQPFAGLSLVDELSLGEGQPAAISSELRAKVMGFGLLVSNWDGEGAEPITPETITTALRVVDHVAILLERKNSSSKPSVRPFPDGSIFFKWIQGQKELAITVQGATVEAQHWEPLDSFQSQGLWEISVGDIPEHIEWVLT